MLSKPSLFSTLRKNAQVFAPGHFLSRNLAALLSLGIDLIFPPRCAGCGKIDTNWCKICDKELMALPFPTGIHLVPPLRDITASAHHGGIIREAVQALKYSNLPQVAIPLGSRMATCLDRKTWTIDIIVPVPLHISRLAERGYNQAKLLADQVAHNTGIPCTPEAMQRVRYSQSQVQMTAEERQQNVKDAFTANPSLVAHKTILIVDDVYTTGSTLANCAEALLFAGAKAVYGLTATAARI